MNYKFPKSERLHSKKLIQELFTEGSSFFLYPFKVYLKEQDSKEGEAPKLLISIPKKKVPKAHNRNLIKRRAKEAYRLNKHNLTASHDILLGFVYVSEDIKPFQEIQESIIKILARVESLNSVTKED